MHSPYTHYVSVAYFENYKYIDSKISWYEEEKAKQIFSRTLNKFKDSAEQVIIQFRDQHHNLIQAERNFGWNIESKKRKKK